MPTESLNRTDRKWASVPIRELGLTIQGTPLEPVLAEFVGELERAGVTRPARLPSARWR